MELLILWIKLCVFSTILKFLKFLERATAIFIKCYTLLMVVKSVFIKTHTLFLFTVAVIH